MATLIADLLEVSNALTLLSIVAGVAAGWWFFYVPRKIGAKAMASLAQFWFDNTKLPFVVHVTNTNTRQFKIKEIHFQTFGRYTNRRKSCSQGLHIDASLLKTDKFLITEGDSTEISFDGYEIANELARGIHGANIRLTSPELKIWLYLTHGIKVAVEVDPKLSAKIITHINETPARTS
jgi:hypothetical protein